LGLENGQAKSVRLYRNFFSYWRAMLVVVVCRRRCCVMGDENGYLLK
jgi:hypothetical protein